MFQFPFDGHQPIANLAQGLSLPQLAKQHGCKLSPAGKTTRVPLGVVLLHCLLEPLAGEQLQQLSKNAAYSIHGGTLLEIGFGFGNPIQPNRKFRQNLIWTGVVGNLPPIANQNQVTGAPVSQATSMLSY
jgi:hypothetical protein